MKRSFVVVGILIASLFAICMRAPLSAQESAPLSASTIAEPQIHDLSPWRMFLGADIVVQAVMVGLAFASLVTWTVFLAKSIELALAKRRLRRALVDLQTAGSLDEARALPTMKKTIVEELLAGVDGEVARTGDFANADAVKERVASSFSEIVKADTTAIRRGTGLLATIGSTAPFVGLFGTVWGIMNSFIGISKAQTTNLAVVAPGIAEALLATAIGLVAAIPAVIIYNHFTRDTKAYVSLVARASGAILRLLSRETEQRIRQAPLRARA